MNRAFMVGHKLYFRPFEPHYVTTEYMDWINDREVIAGMDRHFPLTYHQQSDYIQSEIDNPNVVLFAVFEKESDKLIGAAKLAINWIHRHGTESIFIGDKTAWGKGYGTEMVSLLIKYAFMHLNLDKVYSGVRGDHVGSMRKNEKAGYRKTGILLNSIWSNGKWVDAVQYCITRAEVDEFRTPLVWTDGAQDGE